MKSGLKALVPKPLLGAMRSVIDGACDRALGHMDNQRIRAVLAKHDLNVSKISDYYSPLPVMADLEKKKARWMTPSDMVGVDRDLDAMRTRLAQLVADHWPEYEATTDYEAFREMGLGPGFPKVDGATLYMMLRDLKPSRYVEVGAGLSTAHARQVLSKNAEEGRPCSITCIDPYPNDVFRKLEGIELREEAVQDTPLDVFTELEAGDVLFIDSTHVVKIDGDVPFLFLEVLPRIAPGVHIHIHDVHFPFNIPHPAEQLIFEWHRSRWPVFWTEAMLLQAFLSFNSSFGITLSVPMIRHYDEPFLEKTLPDYQPLKIDDYRTQTSSLWIMRHIP
jgi:predicted O-methyltransferase YrrM